MIFISNIIILHVSRFIIIFPFPKKNKSTIYTMMTIESQIIQFLKFAKK